MTSTTYRPLQKFVHWAIFLLIVGLYALAHIAGFFPKGSDARSLVWKTHISFGLVLLALVVIRIVARFIHGAPGLPAGTPPLEAFLAWVAHLASYALMIAIPVLGVLLVWLHGREPTFFGLFSISSPLAANKELGDVLAKVHEVFATLILIFAGLHAMAAIWHHRVKKDNVLTRMLPKRLLRGSTF